MRHSLRSLFALTIIGLIIFEVFLIFIHPWLKEHGQNVLVIETQKLTWGETTRDEIIFKMTRKPATEDDSLRLALKDGSRIPMAKDGYRIPVTKGGNLRPGANDGNWRPSATKGGNLRPAATPISRRGAHKTTINEGVAIQKPSHDSWTFNKTAKSRIQHYLNSNMNTRDFAILTKTFARIGNKIDFAYANMSRSLAREIYDGLPQTSPFANGTFKRCSVVGNGGILLNSNCGREIDSSDYIFRCNTPPILGHEDDAGMKTNMSSINPNSIIAGKYRRLTEPGYRSKFVWDMKRYGDLLIPVFGVTSGYAYSVLALKHLRRVSTIQAYVINPDHFKVIQELWQKRGLTTNRMTTGLYLASLALSVCDTTHLYGFWPFPIDPSGKPVPYHYYDKLNITTMVHNFSSEFHTLQRLHTEGALQLHTTACQLY